MPQKNLEHLNIQEEGEIEKLLAKLYVLTTKVSLLDNHVIRPLLAMGSVMDHDDNLSQLFRTAKSINELFQVIQEDSIKIVQLAKTIKQAMLQKHAVKESSGLLKDQAKTFTTLLTIEPTLKKLNDHISYIVFTISEIQSENERKDRAAYDRDIKTDIKSIQSKIKELTPTLEKIIFALGHLSHLNNQYAQNDVKGTLQKVFHLEEKDINKLLDIFKSCHKQLSKYGKARWATATGKTQLETTLKDVILPQLQKALLYNEGLQEATQTIAKKNYLLTQYSNSEIAFEQGELDTLASTIKNTFIKLNTNTVPGIITLLHNDNLNKDKINNVLDSLKHVFSTIYKKIAKMQRQLVAIHEINAPQAEFAMSVND